MPENGKEYSMEVVERAEDAYCVDGLTFDQAATLTGVSASTLKRWSERYGWQEKRENIRRARSAIRTNRVMLHAKLIENCLKTLKPMDAFAVSSIDAVVQRATQTAVKRAADGRDTEPLAGENQREIKTEADAVEALREAVEIKLNRMLANPDGLNFSAMKDIRQALDLLREMEARIALAGAPDEEKKEAPRGLSMEAAEKIRREILGIGH